MYIGQYNIQVTRGLSSNRSLLSCTSDGFVDLWSEDDGTGRQKWDIDLLDSPAYFSISVSGGLADPERKFLTFNESGTVRLGPQPSNYLGWVWTMTNATTTPQIPANYCILPTWTPGVTGTLSCRGDGSLVDLHPEDDNSGRQRFQLQGPSFADFPYITIPS